MSKRAATKAQKKRFVAIKELGCIACLMREIPGPVECDVHHLTVGGKHGAPRRGHDYSIGLCSWHHRGQHNTASLHYSAGPSYYHEARKFREVFGDDDYLLSMQNDMLAWKDAA